ncbi:class I SAM-dependent methyltransferase [Galbitalea soli]|uniref:Methyltransferase n=1 Tax=Galbitalea soli TaxID=1268042 RepID=A0A7C9TR28_9MICO|nr:class I SAM-dependent methyltransferase [Galbitalea soli]NEM91876.1 methyltransferase [Galbitalea soli]NYJ29288.1 16S rRNA (guanine1207-N2)-methyltransferase [Galbitalea soli]
MPTLAQPLADAADRLILDEGTDVLASARGAVVVVGDTSGALTAAVLDESPDARVRLHVDSAADELVVRRLFDGDERVEIMALDERLAAGAEVILLRLPKSLAELERLAAVVANAAAPDAVVIAGGRLKYMTVAQNEVLGRWFDRVDVSLARQKSRVLIARGPRRGSAPELTIADHADIDLRVASVGGAFAGSSIDIGTRALLAVFDRLPPYTTAIDLGCGTGILAALLARRAPNARVIATDASAAAVESARATMLANGLDRVEVIRDAGLRSQPEASADLIVLNPPFHDGGAVTTDIAMELFREAGRVLRPGGVLVAVWNSHLAYKSALTRLVGATEEISRNAKFTVTASTSPSIRLGSADARVR